MLEIQRIDAVQVIQFVAPKVYSLNAIDLADIKVQLEYAKQNVEVQGLLLLGSSNCFCAGLDLQDFQKNPVMMAKALDELLIALYTFSKPVVAYVEGHSIGAGMLLQATADWVFIAPNERAKFSLPEFQIGSTIDMLMHKLLESYMGAKDLHQCLFQSTNFKFSDLQAFRGTQIVSDTENGYELSLAQLRKLMQYGKRFSHYKQESRIEIVTEMQRHFDRHCFEVFQ